MDLGNSYKVALVLTGLTVELVGDALVCGVLAPYLAPLPRPPHWASSPQVHACVHDVRELLGQARGAGSLPGERCTGRSEDVSTLGLRVSGAGLGKGKCFHGYQDDVSHRYRAMYQYRPQNEDELELREGDRVDVMQQCDDGWFVGMWASWQSSSEVGISGSLEDGWGARLERGTSGSLGGFEGVAATFQYCLSKDSWPDHPPPT